mmetsp:Transcript_14195/g.34467  ORF Transcript_14195/g.34467 Transcript_14195/m.34467 type:complete len:109 (-) Transcript_14195:634-960(-)
MDENQDRFRKKLRSSFRNHLCRIVSPLSILKTWSTREHNLDAVTTHKAELGKAATPAIDPSGEAKEVGSMNKQNEWRVCLLPTRSLLQEGSNGVQTSLMFGIGYSCKM